MNIGDVVQFNEKHKWCGSLGIVTERKVVMNTETKKQDVRYMVGVPCPMQGTAYIYSMDGDLELEYIGQACLVPRGAEAEEEDEDNE